MNTNLFYSSVDLGTKAGGCCGTTPRQGALWWGGPGWRVGTQGRLLTKTNARPAVKRRHYHGPMSKGHTSSGAGDWVLSNNASRPQGVKVG